MYVDTATGNFDKVTIYNEIGVSGETITNINSCLDTLTTSKGSIGDTVSAAASSLATQLKSQFNL